MALLKEFGLILTPRVAFACNSSGEGENPSDVLRSGALRCVGEEEEEICSLFLNRSVMHRKRMNVTIAMRQRRCRGDHILSSE